MKLARIDHERCREWAHTDYVLIPDDMTVEELDKLAKKAFDLYWDSEEAFKKASPVKHPGFIPDFRKYPDKTVREIQEEHDKLVAVFNEYDRKAVNARKPYVAHLYDASEGKIKPIHETDGPLTVVNWGHRHGETILFDWPKENGYL